MADFSAVQKKLNEDKAFRANFLNDPVSTVKGEGIALTPEMEKKLVAFSKRAQSEQARIAGSTTETINGGVGIGIHF
jgi:hypothetical protein